MNKFYLSIILVTSIINAVEEDNHAEESTQTTEQATEKSESGMLYGFCKKVLGVPVEIAKEVKDHYVKHGEGLEAKRQLAKQDVHITKQNKTIGKLASINSSGIINSLDKNAQATEKVAHSVDKMSETINEGIETVNKKTTIQEKAQVVGIISGAIFIVRSGYEFTKYVYHWAYPTQESQLRKEEVSNQLEYIKARKAFFECLGQNRRDIMNDEGLPKNCEESSKLFFKAAGPMEFDKVRLAFMKR